MSYDVVFQGFVDGAAGSEGGEAFLAALSPWVTRTDPEFDFFQITADDGTADVYLSDASALANHVSGRHAWDLLVRAAVAAHWVVLAGDCPTCLTHEDQLAHLPPELRSDVALVRTGDDLLALITAP